LKSKKNEPDENGIMDLLKGMENENLFKENEI